MLDAAGDGGAGTVTTSGSPATGNITKFSGATSITNGDLSGDVTTSGTLAATVAKVNGTSVPTNSAADQTIVTTGSATGSWASLPSCLDSGGNHLNYNTSTHVFSCGTTGGGGGSTAWSSVTAGTNANALHMGTGGSLDATGTGTIAATSVKTVTKSRRVDELGGRNGSGCKCKFKLKQQRIYR